MGDDVFFAGVAGHLHGLVEHHGQPRGLGTGGFDSDGLPRAVQLVGRTHDEATILRVAAQVERARPWADRRRGLS
ncbi:MAG TPA: hypothetical protein VFR87_06805 [Nocardioidaceae bacterium]|nr:hypothetical protein [Nocardioidaceae bacterium]